MKRLSKAHNILSQLTKGWNLGNYLDCFDKNSLDNVFNAKTLTEVINLWNNPIFDLKCLNTLKDQGFNLLRIPVTWCNFFEIKNNKPSISNEVYAHIKNIIDYALKLDFFVILDMHHDDQTWLNIACTKKEFQQIKRTYEQVWKTIALNFKDYNNKLIFEGMNEIIDRSQEKPDWWGRNKLCFKRLNQLYKLFIKSVRRFSKHNKERTLMISTYGAQIHRKALKHFKMPNDDNLIVDSHYYSKHSNIESLTEDFKFINEQIKTKNVPFILGEIGVKKDCINNDETLKIYLEFLKSNNIKYVLWDNGSSRSFINRQTSEFTHKEMQNYLNQTN